MRHRIDLKEKRVTVMLNSGGPLVSIVVPIFKVEEDLSACVTSILQQSYKNLEIILVDDGSPDMCGAIADGFALNDNRIKVIHKCNGGLSDARNAGMRIASGDYLAFVDSDDIVETNFVEVLLSLLKEYGAGVAVCSNCIFTKKEGAIRTHERSRFKVTCLESDDAVKQMLYQKEYDVSAWGKIYERKLFDGIWFPEGYIFEDIPTIYKVMRKANKVVVTSKKLYKYQIREESIEQEKFTKRKLDGIYTGEMMLRDIENNYPEVLSAARSRYVAINFHILSQIDVEIPEKRIIENNIKSQRINIIFDKEASKKVRIACALSYFGVDIATKVLKLMKRIKTVMMF